MTAKNGFGVQSIPLVTMNALHSKKAVGAILNECLITK
jgi:hypothetical protein